MTIKRDRRRSITDFQSTIIKYKTLPCPASNKTLPRRTLVVKKQEIPNRVFRTNHNKPHNNNSNKTRNKEAQLPYTSHKRKELENTRPPPSPPPMGRSSYMGNSSQACCEGPCALPLTILYSRLSASCLPQDTRYSVPKTLPISGGRCGGFPQAPICSLPLGI